MPSNQPGRNDPCPCGSGRKYKKCCLARDEEARRRAQVAVANDELDPEDAEAAGAREDLPADIDAEPAELLHRGPARPEPQPGPYDAWCDEIDRASPPRKLELLREFLHRGLSLEELGNADFGALLADHAADLAKAPGDPDGWIALLDEVLTVRPDFFGHDGGWLAEDLIDHLLASGRRERVAQAVEALVQHAQEVTEAAFNLLDTLCFAGCSPETRALATWMLPRASAGGDSLPSAAEEVVSVLALLALEEAQQAGAQPPTAEAILGGLTGAPADMDVPAMQRWIDHLTGRASCTAPRGALIGAGPAAQRGRSDLLHDYAAWLRQRHGVGWLAAARFERALLAWLEAADPKGHHFLDGFSEAMVKQAAFEEGRGWDLNARVAFAAPVAVRWYYEFLQERGLVEPATATAMAQRMRDYWLRLRRELAERLPDAAVLRPWVQAAGWVL